MKLSKSQQAVVDILNTWKGSYILYDTYLFKRAVVYTTAGETKMLQSTFDALRSKGVIYCVNEIDRWKKEFKLKQS